MRTLILGAIGLFVLATPGVLTGIIAWSIIFPKHRKIIFNHLKSLKGDTMAAIQTIKGEKKASDKELVRRTDLAELDVNRIEGVDNAFAYLEEKHHEKATTFTPALMVAMFGIGAGLIGTLWLMSTYLPLTANLPW